MIIRSYFLSSNPFQPSPTTPRRLPTTPQTRSSLSKGRARLSTESNFSKNTGDPKEPHSDVQNQTAHDHPPSTSQSSHDSIRKHFEAQIAQYPQYIRRLTSSLPPLHRPTRDELLGLTSGFWERLRIRFKWFTIRGFRKFNTDDISALLSWFVVSQVVWIVVGT